MCICDKECESFAMQFAQLLMCHWDVLCIAEHCRLDFAGNRVLKTLLLSNVTFACTAYGNPVKRSLEGVAQVRAAGSLERGASQSALQGVLVKACPLGQDGEPALADAAIQASAICVCE